MLLEQIDFMLDPVEIIFLEHKHEFLIVRLANKLSGRFGFNGLAEGDGGLFEISQNGVYGPDVVVCLRLQLTIGDLPENIDSLFVFLLVEQNEALPVPHVVYIRIHT